MGHWAYIPSFKAIGRYFKMGGFGGGISPPGGERGKYPGWPNIQIASEYVPIEVYQFWCLYHKMHNSSGYSSYAAPLLVLLCIIIQPFSKFTKLFVCSISFHFSFVSCSTSKLALPIFSPPSSHLKQGLHLSLVPLITESYISLVTGFSLEYSGSTCLSHIKNFQTTLPLIFFITPNRCFIN